MPNNIIKAVLYLITTLTTIVLAARTVSPQTVKHTRTPRHYTGPAIHIVVGIANAGCGQHYRNAKI